VVEIAEVLDRVHGRAARLEALSKLDGIYVPALYEMETLPDGRILPFVDGPKIVKRIARDLNKASLMSRRGPDFGEPPDKPGVRGSSGRLAERSPG